MKNMRKKGPLGILIFAAVFAASAAVVMLLWNWIVPTVIGWGTLTYWHAAGLLLLCKMLFGCFGHGGHGPMMHRRGTGMHPMAMSMEQRARMREEIEGMSPDERREYIRKQMFGCGPAGTGAGKADGSKE